MVNIRPNWVDVPRVAGYNYPKIDTQAIVDVINFILDNNASFRVYDISLGN